MEFWCHQCHAIVRIVTHENSSVSCVQCQGNFVELMDANNEVDKTMCFCVTDIKRKVGCSSKFCTR